MLLLQKLQNKNDLGLFSYEEVDAAFSTAWILHCLSQVLYCQAFIDLNFLQSPHHTPLSTVQSFNLFVLTEPCMSVQHCYHHLPGELRRRGWAITLLCILQRYSFVLRKGSHKPISALIISNVQSRSNYTRAATEFWGYSQGTIHALAVPGDYTRAKP